MSIADRPGLAPGVVGGLMAKSGINFAFLATAPDFDSSVCVSGGFIAALAAGFLAGNLTNFIKKLCDNLPDSLEGIKPILLYPVLGILATGAVMYVLNPIFGAINTAMNAFLGGMQGANIVLLGAIAGGLSAMFGCYSPAPHGGAWVLPVIGNPLMWLVAIAAGSVAGALILSFWKKPVEE